MKGFLSFAVGLILLRVFLPELAEGIIGVLFQVIQKVSEIISNTGTSLSGV